MNDELTTILKLADVDIITESTEKWSPAEQLGANKLKTPMSTEEPRSTWKASPPMSTKAKQFLKLRPAIIARFPEATFYEHPIRGDEHPLVAIIDGKVSTSDFWDVPDSEEAAEYIKYVRERRTNPGHSYSPAQYNTTNERLNESFDQHGVLALDDAVDRIKQEIKNRQNEFGLSKYDDDARIAGMGDAIFVLKNMIKEIQSGNYQ